MTSHVLRLLAGRLHHETSGAAPDVRLLGVLRVRSPGANLLVSLLPTLAHIRGEDRMSVLMRLIAEESRAPNAVANSCLRDSSKCCGSTTPCCSLGQRSLARVLLNEEVTEVDIKRH